MDSQETINRLTQRIQELERENSILSIRVNILERLYDNTITNEIHNNNINNDIYYINNRIINPLIETNFIESPIEPSPSINRSNIRTEHEFPDTTPRQILFPEMDVEIPNTRLFDGRVLTPDEEDRFLEPIMATQRNQLISAVDSYLDEKKRQDSIDDSALLERKWKK